MKGLTKLWVKCLLVVSMSGFSTNAVLASTIKYSFQSATSEDSRRIRSELQTSDALTRFKTLMDAEFSLEQPIEVIFGADDGPLYDAQENRVLVPYAFLAEVEDYFLDAKESGASGLKSAHSTSRTKLEDARSDVLIHTLLHELAHAYLHLYEIPILGREEDAADSFASFFLLEHMQEGEARLLNAAQMFKLESDNYELSADDFWAEHSLDIQRYYATLCHLYGSNPEAYGTLLSDHGVSEERAELCVEDYAILLDSWQSLLALYAK